MLNSITVVIVSFNQLEAHGLASILKEHYSPITVTITTVSELHHLNRADYIFVSATLYRKHKTLFDQYHKHLIIIDDGKRQKAIPSSIPKLCNTFHESEILHRLENIFTQSNRTFHPTENTLTPREVEVLKLIAKGFLNKEIADTLNISLHTVISHRKNITRKLGIKTVAGLTLYALMNQLISPRDTQ